MNSSSMAAGDKSALSCVQVSSTYKNRVSLRLNSSNSISRFFSQFWIIDPLLPSSNGSSGDSHAIDLACKVKDFSRVADTQSAPFVY
jgi:hypothetical protein